MTAPTLVIACPSWCSGACGRDDHDGLHVQDDVLVTGPAHNPKAAIMLRLALTRDDSPIDQGEVRVWLESYDIGLDQAAELATQLTKLVNLGRIR